MPEYGFFMTHIFPYNRNIWVRENPYSGKFYVVKVSNQSFHFVSSNKIIALILLELIKWNDWFETFRRLRRLELRLRVDALIIS